MSILVYIRFLSDEEWGGLGVSLASLAPRHTCVPVSGRIPLSLAVFVGWLFIAFSIVEECMPLSFIGGLKELAVQCEFCSLLKAVR